MLRLIVITALYDYERGEGIAFDKDMAQPVTVWYWWNGPHSWENGFKTAFRNSRRVFVANS